MDFIAKTVLGVMSGTSLDGIDLALVRFEKKERWSFKFIHAETVPYSPHWQRRLQKLTRFKLEELHDLNVDYTNYLGEVIESFLKNNPTEKLDFISSHGHTALHQPQEGITYQIGNLPQLASALGHAVICDFRVADVALGGQGAPLVPGGEVHLFTNYAACVNLGGFANITQLEQQPTTAYDITAVNVVLNALAQKQGMPYDKNGESAASGKLITSLLNELNALSFYSILPPKSLGVEWVESTILPLLEQYQEESMADLLHTYTVHCAKQIAKELPGRGDVLFTGGGAFNSFLMEKIKAFSRCNIVLPENDLIEYKEALIFAFLGVLRDLQLDNCLASVTGAKHNHSSGNIFLP